MLILGGAAGQNMVSPKFLKTSFGVPRCPVLQINNGQVIRRCESISSAYKSLGVPYNRNSISMVGGG